MSIALRAAGRARLRPVRRRQQAGEDRRHRRPRPRALRARLAEERGAARERGRARATSARVAVAAEVIGAQRVDDVDQQVRRPRDVDRRRVRCRRLRHCDALRGQCASRREAGPVVEPRPGEAQVARARSAQREPAQAMAVAVGGEAKPPRPSRREAALGLFLLSFRHDADLETRRRGTRKRRPGEPAPARQVERQIEGGARGQAERTADLELRRRDRALLAADQPQAVPGHGSAGVGGASGLTLVSELEPVLPRAPEVALEVELDQRRPCGEPAAADLHAVERDGHLLRRRVAERIGPTAQDEPVLRAARPRRARASSARPSPRRGCRPDRTGRVPSRSRAGRAPRARRSRAPRSCRSAARTRRARRADARPRAAAGRSPRNRRAE